jgi:phosphoglycerate dehydrogenase-like enzyme
MATSDVPTIVIVPPVEKGTTAPEFLEENGCRVVINREPYPPVRPADVIRLLREADGAIIGGLEQVSDEVMAACPRLRALSRVGVGLNNIDLEAATRRGIAVCSTPGSNSRAVAELAMAMMGMLVRKAVFQHSYFQDGRNDRLTGIQLLDKTLSIIGLGRIGKLVAGLAQAYGMRVIACDIAPDHTFADPRSIAFVPQNEAFRQADILTLHVPLTPLTRSMVRAETLALMKPGAYLINTARGPVVDIKAVAEALKTRHLAGYATDVPIVEGFLDPELQGIENIITTPHIGGYTTEALVRGFQMAAENILDMLAGKATAFTVNPDVFANTAQGRAST